MKMCARHWDALRSAIEGRGLGHLVAANDRDAHARVVADLQGKGDLSDFDPLMDATMMLYGRATTNFSLGILGVDENGEQYCPVCELVKHTPEPPAGHRYVTNELYFIAGPADACLAEAKARGLWPASGLPRADGVEDTGDDT